jgi:hypothetical protein
MSKSALFPTLLLPLLLLAACNINRPEISESYSTMDGFEIGMSKEMVMLKRPTVDFPKSKDHCIEALLDKDDVTLLFENNVLMRISTTNKDFSTERGIRVGDSEEALRRAYDDQLEIQPHKYDEKGNYLFHMGSNGRGIMFETSNDIVTVIHIGQTPALNYVEGCL